MHAFFQIAMVSPGRHLAWRQTVVLHLGLLAGVLCVGSLYGEPPHATVLGYVLLTMGLIEGAALVGWRLTQLPKSQALEFLLVTPLRPQLAFMAETLSGLARLALVTLAGLPVLLVLTVAGLLEPIDVPVLLLVPFTWGALTAMAITAWTYEAPAFRRVAERVLIGLVVAQLAVGVLAGEHLKIWIDTLPAGLGQLVLHGFEAFHRYNPFATLRHWLISDPAEAWQRLVGVEAAALAVMGLLMARSAGRLQGHFHDRHYRPALDRGRGNQSAPGDRPLSWWAVRRVTEYSGRVNLWLAGGFGVLYALYTVAGPAWPAWLGRQVFFEFDTAGGIPVWATALTVLAAVPAAFQYGLWDSHVQDRCRRLELLLLTQLEGRDYWEAAAAAAWRRGRGYFGVAALLWVAAALAGQVSLWQCVGGMAAGVLLWGVYFVVGFRAFSRGVHSNRLGIVLTLGLPGLAFVLYRAGWPAVAALVPPGNVHAAARLPGIGWLAGALLGGVLALAIARFTLARCDAELRRWYDRNQGSQVIR